MRLGKYRVLHELGRGGAGTVYLAEDTLLGRVVALKMLHPSLAMDQQFVARFQAEAQWISALSHPGIVRVHSFDVHEGVYAIDMEYLDAGNLEDYRLAHCLAPREALRVMAHVLESLGTCHEARIIHRDLKPSNVLLSTDGRVCLSDFGLAKSLAFLGESMTKSSQFIGTPKYAAPEAWQGEELGAQSDVYSAGIILLELLGGKTPVDGKSPLEIMRLHIDQTDLEVEATLSQYSPALQKAVASMCAHDPSARPASAHEALGLLVSLPEMEDDAIVPVKAIQRQPLSLQAEMPETPRHPWVIGRLTLGMISLALAVGAIMLAVGYFRPTRSVAARPSRTTVEQSFVRAIHPLEGAVVVHATVPEGPAIWGVLDGADEPVRLPIPIREAVDGFSCQFASFPLNSGALVTLREAAGNVELFYTNGTPEGTQLLDHVDVSLSGRLEILGHSGDRAYYNRMDSSGNFGLWSTDGTREETRFEWSDTRAALLTGFAAMPDGTLFLASRDSRSLFVRYAPDQAFRVVWQADGIGDGSIGELCAVGDTLIFSSTQSLRDRLWRLGPNDSSPEILTEFGSGLAGGLAEPRLTRFRDGVVFAALTADHGKELWFSNGTTDGTFLIHDINDGPLGSDPNRFVESGDRLYLSAATEAHGRELWVVDAPREGARLVLDLAKGVDSSDPYAFCPLNDGLLFSPHAPDTGEELWYTDGTADGTAMVKEFVLGPSGGEPHGTTPYGNSAVFTAYHPDFGRLPWKTDGTAAGTVPLYTELPKTPPAHVPPATWSLMDERVFYTNTTPQHGTEIWISHLPSGNAKLLKDILPGPESSNPSDFVVAGEYLYFVATNNLHGRELWRTQGSPETTTMIFDARPGPADGSPANLTVAEFGLLAFTCLPREDAKRSIFIHFPLDARTVEAASLRDLALSIDPGSLKPGEAAWFFFSVQSPTGTTAIWRTNGSRTEPLPVFGRGG